MFAECSTVCNYLSSRAPCCPLSASVIHAKISSVCRDCPLKMTSSNCVTDHVTSQLIANVDENRCADHCHCLVYNSLTECIYKTFSLLYLVNLFRSLTCSFLARPLDVLIRGRSVQHSIAMGVRVCVCVSVRLSDKLSLQLSCLVNRRRKLWQNVKYLILFKIFCFSCIIDLGACSTNCIISWTRVDWLTYS